MKRLLILLFAFFVLVVEADEGLNKVVYDLTTGSVSNFDKKILKGITANKNYYENKLGELEVAVVIHGDAYKYFVKELETTVYKNDDELRKVYSDLKKRIRTMADTYEVKFLMCSVGMKKNGLSKEQIVDFVEIIPNSTIGLIDKQNEGYAYIPVR